MGMDFPTFRRHADHATAKLGELTLEYILGVCPAAVGILISINTISNTWHDRLPLQPISTYISRVLNGGHYLDIDAIFIPIGGLYLLFSLVTLFNAARQGKIINPFLFIGFVFFPAILLLVSTITNCQEYGDFTNYRNLVPSDYSNATNAINDTFLCIWAMEFYFAIHRADIPHSARVSARLPGITKKTAPPRDQGGGKKA